MATKRKPKSRAKPKAKKVVAKRKAVAPVKRKRAAPVKRKRVAPAKPKRVAPAKPKPAAPAEPGERIGVVTHYYNHLAVAIVKLEKGALRVGETVHIKGHTSDFRQPVESLQIEHADVSEVHAGDEFGLRVKEHAREHDVVYRVVA